MLTSIRFCACNLSKPLIQSSGLLNAVMPEYGNALEENGVMSDSRNVQDELGTISNESSSSDRDLLVNLVTQQGGKVRDDRNKYEVVRNKYAKILSSYYSKMNAKMINKNKLP